MSEENIETSQTNETQPVAESKPEAAPIAKAEQAPPQGQGQGRPESRPPRGDRPPRENRGERGGGGGGGGENRGDRGGRPQHGGGGPGGGSRGGDRGDRGPDRGDRGRFDRRPDLSPEIEYDKLVSDSLYLDNQAHAVVSRMRDMDSATRSQLRRLYNAIRRAVRTPESERQHEFVMLRARLAYTIARHSLRSLDGLEKLLLQVTRKNEARGYERFRDLFEAIIAYNE